MAQSKTEKLEKLKAKLFHAVANDAWTVNRYQAALEDIANMQGMQENGRLHVQISQERYAPKGTFEKLHTTVDPELMVSIIVAKRNEYREYVRLVVEKIKLLENRTEADDMLLEHVGQAWKNNQFAAIMQEVDAAYPSRDWQYRGEYM